MKDLTDLIDTRTSWIRTLDQIHGLMAPGMWLTALKPNIQQTPAGRSGTMTATAFCKSVEIKKIKEVESVNEFVLDMTFK